MLGLQEIQSRFFYHPPSTDGVRRAHESVQNITGEVAELLDRILDDGREKSLAITKLEECRMWANASIARNQTGAEAEEE